MSVARVRWRIENFLQQVIDMTVVRQRSRAGNKPENPAMMRCAPSRKTRDSRQAEKRRMER